MSPVSPEREQQPKYSSVGDWFKYGTCTWNTIQSGEKEGVEPGITQTPVVKNKKVTYCMEMHRIIQK